jgi:chromosome segregation ATPase
MKSAIVALAILVVGLGTALWHQYRRAHDQQTTVETDSHRWSNRWYQSQETLSVTAQNSAQLHTSLLLRDTLLAATSNELSKATRRVTESAAVVAEQQAELSAASAELTERDGQVIQLQARRQELERALESLKADYSSLRGRWAEATAAVEQGKARERQQETALAALNLERELMFERSEKLEAAQTTLRAELAAVRGQLQAVQKRFLTVEESSRPTWMDSLAAKFQRLEQAQAKLMADWNNLATVRQRLAQLQQAEGSDKAIPERAR